MKARILITTAIFLMIFSFDEFLLLDSSIPECKGFTGMGWIVLFHLGFESMAILSNPECLNSFYAQTFISILFAIGVGLIVYLEIKIHNNKMYCDSKIK